MEAYSLRERWLEISLLVSAVLVISALHYATASGHYYFHDIYRRLYYLPIIVAAFRFGMVWAVATSVLTSAVYIPHAFFFLPNIDPQGTVDKLLEIALYNIVAVVAGWLVMRLRAEARRHHTTAEELRETLAGVKRIQYQLRLAERMAAIGQLTAGLAHEIRNPLGSIQGAAEVCADDFPPGHPKREMATVLLDEVGRLTAFLDRFLDFAKPRELQFGRLDLGEELRAVAEMLGQRTKGDKHSVKLRLGNRATIVNADAVRLRQVFLNVGLNALEAMPDGGILEIAVGDAERDGGSFVAVEFRDTGTGIESQALEQMFNPFFTTKPGGTGLGLAISYRIVGDHGGRVEVTSIPQRGTKVTVLLPEKSIYAAANSSS